MSDKPRAADPELAFWGLFLKVGVPLASVGVLYLLARKGDNLALAILIVVGTVTLIGLGVLVTLAIMRQLQEAERARDTRALYEQMQLVGHLSKIQGSQAQSLLAQNGKLIQTIGQLPDPRGIDVRDRESVTWEVMEEEYAQRRY